jgi:hypothetical protein
MEAQPKVSNNRGGRDRGKVRALPSAVTRGHRAGELLPQNLDAEAGVLGSILIDPDALVEAARIVVSGDFYRDAHQTIFAAALDLHGRGLPVDLITLCDALEQSGELERVGGADYVSSLANNVPNSANLAHYARLVKRTATHRALIRASGQIAAIDYGDPDAGAAVAMAEAAIKAVRDAARLEARFELLTLRQLDTLPLPEWLIGNTLQRDSLAMVYGVHSTGKSYFCGDIALTVAAQLCWQGLAVKGGPVVYVASEGGRGFGLRTQAWRQEHGLEDVPGFYLVGEPVQLLDVGAVLEFIAVLETLPAPPVLIVIDTLGRSMSGGDELSNSDAHDIISAADQIRRATGACVVLVHHEGKTEGKGPRGASAFASDVDTLIHLKRDEDGDTTVVTCEKQKDGETFKPFSFKLRQVALDEYADVTSCVIEPAEVRPAPAPARSWSDKHSAALAALVGHPEGLTAKEWHDETSLTRATFYRTMKELVGWKYVHLASERYFLTNEGQEKVS